MFRSVSPLGGSRTASPRPGNRTPRSGSLAVVDSRGAQGAGGRSLTPTNFALGPGDIGGIGKKDRAIQQLVAEESAALNFLARRGSEAEKDSGEEEFFDEEAMANAERELAADAEWKRIQQNTFTRWANEHLKQADKSINDLETDLSDGLKLIALIEVLSGKRMPRHNKKPNFRSQKLENVSIALEFLEREGVFLVNIDSTDIVDCKLKLILGLIWTLILHYAISMPMWDGPPLGGMADQDQKTPKQRLMDWVKDKMPDCPVNNFTSDWKDGKAVGALVDSVAPGLCPNWEDWDPSKPVENATEAMDLADKWLNVPKLLTPEEIVNPNVDEQSMMTYLSQFPNARLKPGAPLRQKINENKVRAYGPGLEPTGLVANAPANFTVETFGAGDGDLVVEVKGPSGEDVTCDMVFNNDRKVTYSCSYMPEVEGEFVVNIFWSKRTVPKSPYHVQVEGFAGDASKVTAAGPGLEPEGVVINKPTFFDIYTEGAGKGIPEVIILDPKGKKDSVPLKITPSAENPETYRCEYVATMLGLHSVNVFFAGNPIPKSPFGVKVSPASLPSKVWANGRGLQPNGIRINETVSFKVYTEGAGEGEVAVKIIGPGGVDLPINQSRKLSDNVTEYTYTPRKQGRHIVMITFANQEIPRSPFEVNVGPVKNSNIKAYGPGLKGGVVNKPARFTVDTCGETGALGFSIEGPSQAKINCQDNGDGSADVDYIPTAEGEYAVHILCDKEDIPGSPYMAQILPQTDFDPDKVKAFGPGLENGVNPKESTHFTIDTTEAGEAPLEVAIVDDLGEYKPEIKKKTEKVFECTYTPRNGQHKQTILVNFGGVAVPGSPFHVLNDNPNDPSLVKVYGPGVEKGVCAGKPVDFTVDCTKSGPGHVNVNITSSKRKTVPVSIVDNKDDTYTVTYEATDAGPQKIIITLDDTEVPQSPIKLDIKPAVDLSKISLIEFEPEAYVDCINDFTVDTSGLPPDQRADIQCDISGPDGSPVDCFVNKMGPDGPYQISYTPCESGDHEIDLRHEDKPLPDSPFPVLAKRGNNPNKVKAYGDGLEKGIVDENNYFTIETKNAGTGGLGLAMEGPSEATVQCVDNQDGSCTVDYIPNEEGDYDITIKFGDTHIPGSPFRVPCVTKDGKPKPNASKVDAYGPGLDPESVFPGKPTNFIVDASKTGEAPVDVSIENNDGSPIENLRKPSIINKGDGIHEVTYVPPPVGDPYEVSVTYGGIEIPGSPFDMTSSPDLNDVVGDVNKTKSGLNSRKSSDLSPERNYHKNGTGLMRDGSIDDGNSGSRKNSAEGNERKGSHGRGNDSLSDKNFNKRGSRSGNSRADPALEEIVHDESRRGSRVGGRAGVAGIDGAGLRRGSEFDQPINEESDNYSDGAGMDSRKSSSIYGAYDSRKSSALSNTGSVGINDDDSYSRKGSAFGSQSRKGSDISGLNSRKGSNMSGTDSRKGSGLSGPYNTDDAHGAADKNMRKGSGCTPDVYGTNDSRKGSRGDGILENEAGDLRKGSRGDGFRDGDGLNSRKGSQIVPDGNRYGDNSPGNIGYGDHDDQSFGPGSRKGSNLSNIDSRKGSKYGNERGSVSRKVSNLGGDSNSRKGSKSGDDNEDDRNTRKGPGMYDDSDSDSYGDGPNRDTKLGSQQGRQRKSTLDDIGNNEDGLESSRKGSRYGPGANNAGQDNRKGSDGKGYGGDDERHPNDSSGTRKGSGYNREPRDGNSSDLDSDIDSRKNSRLGPDSRKGSGYGGPFDGDQDNFDSDQDRRRSKISGLDRDGQGGGDDSNARKGSGYDGPNFGKDGYSDGPEGDRRGSKLSGMGRDAIHDIEGNNSRKGSGYYGSDSRKSSGMNSLEGDRLGSKYSGSEGPSSRDLDGSLNSRKGSANDGSNNGSNGRFDEHKGDRRGSKFSGTGRDNLGNDPSSRKGSDYKGRDSRKPSGIDGSEGDRQGYKLSGTGSISARDDDNNPNSRKGSGYDSQYPGRRTATDGIEGDRKGSKGSGIGEGYPYDDINSRKGSGYGAPGYGDDNGLGPRNSNSRKGSDQDGPYSNKGDDDRYPNMDRKGSKLSGLNRGNYGDLDDDYGRKGSGYDSPYGERRGSKLSDSRRGIDSNADNDNLRKGSKDLDGINSRKGSGHDDPYGRNQRNFDGSDTEGREPRFSRDENGHPLDLHGINSCKGSGLYGPNSGRQGELDGSEGDRRGSKFSQPGKGCYGGPEDGSNRKGSGNGPYNDGNSSFGPDSSRRGSNISKPGQGGYGGSDDGSNRKGSGNNNPYNANPNRPYNDGDSSFDPDSSRRGSKISKPRQEGYGGPDDGSNRKGSGANNPYNANPGSPYNDGDSSFDPDSSRRGSKISKPGQGGYGGPIDGNNRKGSGNDSSYNTGPRGPYNDEDSSFGPDSSRRGSKYSKSGQEGYGGPDDENYRKGSGNQSPFKEDPKSLFNVGDSSFGPDASRRGSNYNGPNNGRANNEDSGYYDNFGPHSRKGSNLFDDGVSNNGSPSNDSRKQSAKYPPLELHNIPLSRTGGNVSADIKKPSYRKNSGDTGSRKGSGLSGIGNSPSDNEHGPDEQRKGSFGNNSQQRNISCDNGSPYSNVYGTTGPNSRKGSGSDGQNGRLDSRKGSGADGRGYGPDSRKGSGADGRGYGPDSRKGSDSMYPNSDSRKGSNSDGRGYGSEHHKLSNTSSVGGGDGIRKSSGPDGRRDGPDSRKSSDLYGDDNNKYPDGIDHPILTDNGNGSVGVFYQPEEEGLHILDIKQNGDHVQGSPYKFHVSPMDDGKVHATGSGLVHGVCGDPANFIISTKGAGAGGLSLAVEGPSKAEINCQDNKDGTVNVSYLPTAPGEYKIYAKFADQHIDGSPFTCKVTGEGTKRNTISVGSSSDLSLPENLSEYDLRALNAYIVSPSGVEEPCFLKKLPKGNNGISFTPREVGEHLVSVKRNGKHIKNSPFKIMVNREDVGDASRVKVDGETLREGRTQQDNTFTVDTKNAGYGGLSLSVEGPSKAEIKCKDNEDGTLEVSYKPTEPGLYIVNLKFADQHIPGSPFAVAVSGEGSTKQTENINRLREAVPITEVGSQCRLTFKMPGISCSDLRASVMAPTGKVESAVVAELEDGLYAVNFVPYELGIHTVSVMYRDVDIPGSPFQFTVGPLQDGGAHRVHAGGPGLERGIQGQAADFNVWTREAGHGSLAISVEGPSKAEVDFNDRKDGSCHVSYVVEEPGEYSVGIRFNDTHIPGSPYKVCILPSAEEAERVRLSNVADSPVSTDIPQTMLLNMNGAGGDVECKLVSPSGREDDCFITPLGTPGEHSVRFVPKEEGVHYLHAKLNGVHIPGSPFKLVVSNLTSMMNNNNADPSSTVSVHGKGITGGVTGQASIFTIDTSDVGAGTLAITVDGPSKVDLSCNEVDDGYEVAYTPMVPGKYFVTVKYNGNNINGSPFSVQVGGDNLNTSSREERMQRQQSKRSSVTMETMSRTSYVRHQYSESRRGTIQGATSTNINSNNNMLCSSLNYDHRRSSAIPDFGNSQASHVKCSGSGIENAKANRHNSFMVDCSKAGNNILYVGVYGPETPCEEVVIKHKGSKRYSVDYVVRERGQYIIFVKWGDEHVAGSPFHIDAN